MSNIRSESEKIRHLEGWLRNKESFSDCSGKASGNGRFTLIEDVYMHGAMYEGLWDPERSGTITLV